MVMVRAAGDGALRVLVVDDEESVRHGCAQALEGEGFRTEMAADGRECLRRIEQSSPDVVILDLWMPGVTGIDVLKKIRSIDPDIVPIVITGYGTPELATEAMKLGAVDFLCKPFDGDGLVDAVRTGVRNRSSIPSLFPGRAEGMLRHGAPARVRQPLAARKRFLSPGEVAAEVVKLSKGKCETRTSSLILLGILAGAYIAFGAQLCTMVTHDLSRFVGVGMAKLVGGSVFSVGLMLVVLAGAELFTGNCLIAAGVLSGKCSAKGMLRNWTIVYVANFAGSLLLAAIIFGSGLWKTGGMGVGAAALKTAVAKVDLSFLEAFLRGIGCNWLVCLAVWLALAGRDTVSRILGIYFPIMAFVASGFEHSIANMYFVPVGIFLKGSAAASASGLGDALGGLTWTRFLAGNLLPVTLGNIVGGALFVAGIYYMVYLRRSAK
jgi:formate/nitrite transporter